MVDFKLPFSESSITLSTSSELILRQAIQLFHLNAHITTSVLLPVMSCLFTHIASKASLLKNLKQFCPVAS